MPLWQRILTGLWSLLTVAESVSFVLAVTLAVLALAYGKTGLKKWNKRKEDRAWRYAGWAGMAKLGLMAITMLVSLFFYFKR